MGREVRMVHENWEHPKYENGKYIPLMNGDFSNILSKYKEEKSQWEKGFRTDFEGGWKPKSEDELKMSFIDWNGEEPKIEDYMPQWEDDEKTHLQMYEDTSEGTPISPIFSNANDLARWLSDNNASAFGGMTAAYEEWLSMIGKGYAVGMVMDKNGLRSGVAGTL